VYGKADIHWAFAGELIVKEGTDYEENGLRYCVFGCDCRNYDYCRVYA
jgi:hypothetical protein